MKGLQGHLSEIQQQQRVACPVWIGLMRSAPAMKMTVLNLDVTLFKDVLNQKLSQIISTYDIASCEQS
jgi:hypothetical protein